MNTNSKEKQVKYFDKVAYCCICNKNLSLNTFRSRFQLLDGWLCNDCIKLAGGFDNIKRKTDTIKTIKEKINDFSIKKKAVDIPKKEMVEKTKEQKSPFNVQKEKLNDLSTTQKNTSNKLAEKIMKYQSYNPYLKECDDRDVRKACKDCNCLKDVYHTAINYIEDNNTPTSIYLLIKANFGLGVLYTERTIYYAKKYLGLEQNCKTEEEKNEKLMEVCEILSECYKKDYLIEEELKYRELTLNYSIAWWETYKNKLPYPQPMEFYGNKNIRTRITELKNDLKSITKIEKETGKAIDLKKPFTNRKILKRIDVNTNTIYNLLTGEIIE